MTKAGEGGDVFAGQLHQIIALQRVLGGAHNALVHVPQQLFPQMQIADGGGYGDQFAVGAARNGFAMHVTDMTTKRACGAGGGLVLPMPIANADCQWCTSYCPDSRSP